MADVDNVDPEMEENEIEGAEMVEPVRVERDSAVVVIEAVEMEEPWMVLTVMAGATTFRRALKLARVDAIYYSLLFCGMNHNTKYNLIVFEEGIYVILTCFQCTKTR